MTKEEIHSIWAPDNSCWAPWAKPVLFAYLDDASSYLPVTETVIDTPWAPAPSGKVALVIDFPGADGVFMGVALARRGYRPVPLYNAVPLPAGHSPSDDITGRPVAAVDMVPIMSALRRCAEGLATISIAPDAPPVFLLDSRRSARGRQMNVEEFDNRSISFSTDFPSANFLASRGIERALLIQQDRCDPQEDLAHTLLRWQESGIKIESKRLDTAYPARSLEIKRPNWYGMIFQRALSSLGLRRARAGGFGAWMPSRPTGG